MDKGRKHRGGGRRADGPRTPRRGSTRPATRPPRASARSVFRAFEGAGASVVGLAAYVEVREALGGAVDSKTSTIQAFVGGPDARRRPNAAVEKAARRLCRRGTAALSRVLDALGSTHRLAIMMQLLEGPATYGSLQRRTRLKAGPLYHHINQLRLTDLVGPKSRDTYVLTRAGRNALLVMLSLEPLLKDARIRPLPMG